MTHIHLFETNIKVFEHLCSSHYCIYCGHTDRPKFVPPCTIPALSSLQADIWAGETNSSRKLNVGRKLPLFYTLQNIQRINISRSFY